jgi:hypothetical protein
MIQCAIPRAGRDVMSDPYGNYTFAGLGFTGLLFMPADLGRLFYGEGSVVVIEEVPAADAEVAFNAPESPLGAINLKFVGSLIFDTTGNVTAMAGTWTGTAFIFNPQTARVVEPVVGKVPPFTFPRTFAHGAWSAFNRQPP